MTHLLSHNIGFQSYVLFDILFAGVVSCGGTKKSHRIYIIVQIIFSFWSFEISEIIRINQKIIIGSDSFLNQRLMYLAPFGYY